MRTLLPPNAFPAGKESNGRPVGSVHRLYFSAQQWGFTVVELVVIVAIIALLLILAVPNFTTWRANARLKTAARDVVSQIQFARLEAARRNASILIQVNTGGPGTGNCIVFVDDGSGGGVPDNQNPEPGEIVRQFNMPVSVTLSGTTNTIFQYSNRGFPVVGGGGTVTLTNGGRTYNVDVALAGGVSLRGPI